MSRAYDLTDAQRAETARNVTAGYRAVCRECGEEQPLFPDYYGIVYYAEEDCPECGFTGFELLAEPGTLPPRSYYYLRPTPGDGPAYAGPFAHEAEARHCYQRARGWV